MEAIKNIHMILMVKSYWQDKLKWINYNQQIKN